MKSAHLVLIMTVISIVIGETVYYWQNTQSQNIQSKLNSQISQLQSEIRDLKATKTEVPAQSPAQTPTSSINDQAANTSESSVRKLVDDFEAALKARDAQRVLNSFTDPVTDTEKSTLNFLKGTDINGSIRLFSTRASGSLQQYAGFKITNITNSTNESSHIELTQHEIIQIQKPDSLDENLQPTDVEDPYILEAKQINGVWKVDKFYKVGTPSEFQKYNDSFAN